MVCGQAFNIYNLTTPLPGIPLSTVIGTCSVSSAGGSPWDTTSGARYFPLLIPFEHSLESITFKRHGIGKKPVTKNNFEETIYPSRSLGFTSGSYGWSCGLPVFFVAFMVVPFVATLISPIICPFWQLTFILQKGSRQNTTSKPNKNPPKLMIRLQKLKKTVTCV